jgi:hypothetical protein
MFNLEFVRKFSRNSFSHLREPYQLTNYGENFRENQLMLTFPKAKTCQQHV